MSGLRGDEAELMKYMAPGSTINDLVSEDDDSDYDAYFDVVERPKGEETVVAPSGQASGAVGGATHANTQKSTTSMAKFQPAQHKNTNASVLGRIRVDEYYDGHSAMTAGASGGAKMNQRVLTELRDMTMSSRFVANQSSKKVDRAERATVENVMDPRTRLILYKLVNSGMLKEINGCVSTGKEANVYYALSADGSPAAIKVYKTSILSFKDRDQYVSGEFRFQRYCKSNPRKMVRTWAEKEARNLSRLQDGAVLAPAVKLLRQHVLVMEFLGEDGWPAPRLKDVRFPSQSALDQCYLDLCCTMRKMFGRCKLIHGDLSEYNLLFYRGRVVVIDVSQSVESDHPRAMDFLRRDIVNVNAFFRSQGHRQLFKLQDLFHFIVATPTARGWQRCSGPDNVPELMAYLKELRESSAASEVPVDAEQAAVDEQVFLNIIVPRTLQGISDDRGPNAEVAEFVQEMTATSQKRNKHVDFTEMAVDGNDEDDEEDEGEDEEVDGEEDEEDDDGEVALAKPKKPAAKTLAEMTKEERKANRKAVKQAKQEKQAEKKKNGLGKKKKK